MANPTNVKFSGSIGADLGRRPTLVRALGVYRDVKLSFSDMSPAFDRSFLSGYRCFSPRAALFSILLIHPSSGAPK